MSTSDVRPRISASLAQLLRTAAALHQVPTIGAYLDTVVRPMVRADIARLLSTDPTLDLAAPPEPDVVVPVAAVAVAPSAAVVPTAAVEWSNQ